MIKKKKINNIITTFVFSIFCLMMTAKPTYASTYYIRALLDEGNFGVICQVVSDKGDSTGPDGTTGYLERANGYDFSAIANYGSVYKGGGSSSTPGSSLIANIVQVINDKDADPEKIYEKLKAESDANKPLVFSFPGIVTGDVKYKAMSSDFDRAQLVAETLSGGLNEALGFIQLHSGTENISEDGLRHVLAQLARITAQFRNSATEGEFNAGPEAGNKNFKVGLCTPNKVVRDMDNKQVKIKDVLIPINDLKYADYAYISTTDRQGKTVYGYFPWRMMKGYALNQPLYNKVSKQYREESASQGENQHLTWGQLIIQAGLNADIRGATVVDSSQDVMTLIGQGLGADLTSTITSVRSMLNLLPIQQLILNMDSRESDYHQGVMPQNMYDTAKEVYVLVLVVSLLFLSTLIIKMIHQKMISTTNIIAKTSLMEGVQDILFVGIMLAFFPTIFEILLELNVLIVDTFGFSSEYMRAYGLSSSKVLSTESIAGFVVSSMFLSIDIYINTTYLVRAIVVSFLFAISPILTVSYCWGPMQKKLYFSYMRELVGNIFMQSFHAITMTFFAGYNRQNMSSMEALASAYCFIPVTQLFRQLVIGSQGGFSESLGGKLAGQLTNTATGLHKSVTSMKQNEEMMNTMASNAKSLSGASFGAQIVAEGASLIGEYGADRILAGGVSKNSKEIGSNGGGNNTNNIVNASPKTGGGTPSWGRTAAAIGAKGVLNAGANGLMSMGLAKQEESNRGKLGELQMKHSMENMGIGMAQAGMGIGISSFEGAAGNAMVGAGLASVQTGAAKYGEGASNAGSGGSDWGAAYGFDNARFMVGNSLASATKDYSRNRADYRRETIDAANKQAEKDKRQAERGLTKAQMLGAMGVTNAEAPQVNQEINVSAEKGTNNVMVSANVDSLKAMESNNATLNYMKAVANEKSTPEEISKALDLAKKQDGFDPSFGGQGTGFIKDGNTISFIMKNMNQYGLEVEGNQAFSIVDNKVSQMNTFKTETK